MKRERRDWDWIADLAKNFGLNLLGNWLFVKFGCASRPLSNRLVSLSNSRVSGHDLTFRVRTTDILECPIWNHSRAFLPIQIELDIFFLAF